MVAYRKISVLHITSCESDFDVAQLNVKPDFYIDESWVWLKISNPFWEVYLKIVLNRYLLHRLRRKVCIKLVVVYGVCLLYFPKFGKVKILLVLLESWRLGLLTYYCLVHFSLYFSFVLLIWLHQKIQSEIFWLLLFHSHSQENLL